MGVTHTVKTVVLSEYADDVPSHARITIDNKLLSRIMQLHDAVKKLKAFYIADMDYTPDYMVKTDDDEPLESWESGSMESVTLRVTESTVYWHGYVKHTDFQIETESITIKELKENFKVMTAKDSTIPLLLNHLKYETSRALFNERLKK